MADYIKIDAEQVSRHIENLILRFPELADDEALREDMISGETDLDKVVERALDHMAEADMMVSAIKERCSVQQERQQRYQNRSDAMRSLIKDLMETANLRSLPLPEATVSLANGRQTVVITSVDELPQGYVAYEPKPDKKAIGDALKAGEDIPGAMLQTGDTSLTVRRK